MLKHSGIHSKQKDLKHNHEKAFKQQPFSWLKPFKEILIVSQIIFWYIQNYIN